VVWALIFLLFLAILGAGIFSFFRRIEDRPFAWLWWLPIAYLTAMGIFGLLYQGYVEDAGDKPIQSWRLAAISLPLAAVMAWTALRRQRPTPFQFWAIILALIANLAVTWHRQLGVR
jgi:hypothetical protein